MVLSIVRVSTVHEKIVIIKLVYLVYHAVQWNTSQMAIVNYKWKDIILLLLPTLMLCTCVLIDWVTFKGHLRTSYSKRGLTRIEMYNRKSKIVQPYFKNQWNKTCLCAPQESTDFALWLKSHQCIQTISQIWITFNVITPGLVVYTTK